MKIYAFRIVKYNSLSKYYYRAVTIIVFIETHRNIFSECNFRIYEYPII